MTGIGFNNFAEHVVVRKVPHTEVTSLKKDFRESGLQPKSRLLFQPVTNSPLLLARYRRGELHSVSPCGASVSWKLPHLAKLASPAPESLSEISLDQVSHHLQVSTENVFVLGQLNLTEESWHHIRHKLHTLSTMKDLVKYLFRYKKVNPKLTEMLHFHALDMLALSNGTLVRIPPNGMDSYQRLQSFGFHQLWAGVNPSGGPLAVNARDITPEAVMEAVTLLKTSQSNAEFGVSGVRITPLFRPKELVFATAFC